jgi:hypothetical protein
MAVVAGVLLDHVNEQFAQRDWFARTVAPDELEVGIAGELLGEGDLVVPCTPGVLDHCLIAHRTVEVAVWLCLGLIPSGYVLAAETLPEPLAFDIGQVAHQTKERHR